MEERNIFISHSRYDTRLLPWFENIFSVAHVAMNKIEFEKPLYPAKAILEDINKAESVFVLLSKPTTWSLHTQSWIVAESTIGYMLEKPVLVFVESKTSVMLPLPYLDFYTRIALNQSNSDAVYKLIETGYYPSAFEQLQLITCPHHECHSEFRTLNPPATLGICPTCLRAL